MRPFFLVSVALSAILTAAPVLADPSSSAVPDVGRAPGLLRKIAPNLRTQPAVGIPIGNVRITAGPNGETEAQTFSLPRGSTAVSIGLGGAHSTIIKPASVAMVCTLKANMPHDSHHNPGRINVTGFISCSSPVNFLDIGVGLYLDTHLIAANYYSKTFTNFIQTNAASDCLYSGVYQGGAVGAVTFPPGFEPPWSNFGGAEASSNPIYIKC